MIETDGCVSRRTFLGAAASCSAHLLFLASGATSWGALPFARSNSAQVVVQQPWGRLERVGEGLWALISTPLEDRTTLCNGGIIAGAAGTLVVESYASPKGATWMAERARDLTGKWPSHVVLTHFHGDHTGGIEGFAVSGTPRILATETTRDLVVEQDARREVEELRRKMIADVTIINPTSVTHIDLGGRVVHIVPREGHTPSDVSIELEEPSVVWCGDLVWNHMFPNYRDAIPSLLSQSVRDLTRSRETVYVPGHGPLADRKDLDSYVQVIDLVEIAARLAFEQGVPAVTAAEGFSLPLSVGEWMMFSPRYYEVALSAWERELESQ
jgi:glyoxylase-like metal-dependent hydrolase (beta-lactamase superfamily II)